VQLHPRERRALRKRERAAHAAQDQRGSGGELSKPAAAARGSAQTA